MKGNSNLCRAIVRAGARLGVNNNQGINIFNYQVATKQLLFRLLGQLCGSYHNSSSISRVNVRKIQCNSVTVSENVPYIS